MGSGELRAFVLGGKKSLLLGADRMASRNVLGPVCCPGIGREMAMRCGRRFGTVLSWIVLMTVAGKS